VPAGALKQVPQQQPRDRAVIKEIRSDTFYQNDRGRLNLLISRDPSDRRLDLNGDGAVNARDAELLKGFIGQNCQ
jgi:hypothetical protein